MGGEGVRLDTLKNGARFRTRATRRYGQVLSKDLAQGAVVVYFLDKDWEEKRVHAGCLVDLVDLVGR